MKSKSINRVLPRLAVIMVCLFLIVILPMNIWFQVHIQHQNQQENALELFGQLEQVIKKNEKELERTKQGFEKRCIRSADVVAFSVMHDKDIMYSLEETKAMAEKMDIDEINFFTPEGELFAGTNPEYYGYTLGSGEQMSFFESMLYDKSLKLCQDIEPNTAEGKEMQYAAVWLEDGSGIVQIGMEPKRLSKEMEMKSLSNIIAEFPFQVKGFVHVVERDTQKVVASTAEYMRGRDMSQEDQTHVTGKKTNLFHQKFRGQRYCVYTKVYGNYVFIRSYESSENIKTMMQSSFLMILYTIIGSIGIIWMIRWYVKHKLILNLDNINQELRKIEDGNVEKIVLDTGVKEFDSLLFYINQMLNFIRSNWNKLSYIIDKGGIPIGVYEKNEFYHKTFMNERITEILGIKRKETLSSEELGGCREIDSSKQG